MTTGLFEGLAGHLQHPASQIADGFANGIREAHANALVDELRQRSELEKRFKEIADDPSYPDDAKLAARHHALTLAMLPPTKKRPKEYQPDKAYNGDPKALFDITYKKVMRDGPSQPAQPPDPSAPTELAPPPDVSLSDNAAGMPPSPGGAQSTAGKISPGPAIAPPPSIGGSMGGSSSAAGPSNLSASIPPPPVDMSQFAPARRSGEDMAAEEARINDIKSQIPIDPAEAESLGLRPGTTHVHPKVLDNLRKMENQRLRNMALGIDENGALLPWKQEQLDAANNLKEAQTKVQEAIASGKPEEIKIALMKASAAMESANAAMTRANRPDPLLAIISGMNGGGGGGGAHPSISGNKSDTGGSGGPDSSLSSNWRVHKTNTGYQWADLTGISPKERLAFEESFGRAGITPVSDKNDAATLKDINAVRLNLDSIDQTIQGVLPADAMDRPMKSLTNYLNRAFQTNDGEGALMRAVGAFRTAAIKSVKAVAGRGGGFRMTEAEINLAVDQDLPKITDTVRTWHEKMHNLQAMLDNNETSMLSPSIEGKKGSRGQQGDKQPDTSASVKQTIPAVTYDDAVKQFGKAAVEKKYVRGN